MQEDEASYTPAQKEQIQTMLDAANKASPQQFSAFVNCEQYNISMTPIAQSRETKAEAYLIICESEY